MVSGHQVTESGTGEKQPMLSWRRDDVEQRLGFRGAQFTRVNSLLSSLSAAVITFVVYGILYASGESAFSSMFLKRGPVPYFIVFFGAWALIILVIKSLKLRHQRKALGIQVVPERTDFIISANTAHDILANIQAASDEPKFFILLNRISIALSNLKNLGRVPDVDEILRTQADHDESIMETSYTLVRGFVWAIPVLGFIGTVMGLSDAIGGFGQVLSSTDDMSQLSSSLQMVTSGLATAFETTLLALVVALFVHLVMTFLKKSEEEFLDECSDYCQRFVVGKLRMMQFDDDGGSC